MFVLDNLLLAPGKALFFVFQELARKAQEDWLDDDSIKKELQEIYALLDAGKIDDRDFQSRECSLLQRLEQIARMKFEQKWGGPGMPPQLAAMNDTAGAVIDAEIMDHGVSAESGAVELNELPRMAESSSSNFGAGILQALRPLLDLAGNQVEDALPQKPDRNPPFKVEAGASVHSLPQPRIRIVEPGPSSTSSPSDGVLTQNSTDTAKPALDDREFLMSTTTVPIAHPVSNPPPPSGTATEIAKSGAIPARKIGLSEIVENAIRGLALTRLKVSSITSVGSVEGGWKVGVELVERASVPDTNDLLGVYEVQLDESGTVTRYERTRVRRRNDLSRT